MPKYMYMYFTHAGKFNLVLDYNSDVFNLCTATKLMTHKVYYTLYHSYQRCCTKLKAFWYLVKVNPCKYLINNIFYALRNDQSTL